MEILLSALLFLQKPLQLSLIPILFFYIAFLYFFHSLYPFSHLTCILTAFVTVSFPLKSRHSPSYRKAATLSITPRLLHQITPLQTQHIFLSWRGDGEGGGERCMHAQCNCSRNSGYADDHLQKYVKNCHDS